MILRYKSINDKYRVINEALLADETWIFFFLMIPFIIKVDFMLPSQQLAIRSFMMPYWLM